MISPPQFVIRFNASDFESFSVIGYNPRPMCTRSFSSLAHSRLGHTLILSLALALPACGGTQNKAKDANEAVVDNEDEFEDDGMGMTQEFGGMNERKVTSVFKRAQPSLVECVTDAGADQEYLVGGVAFLVTVDQAGQAISAHMERSNLGSYSAERCMLDVLLAEHWPKPVGGRKGLARNGIEYDPGDVRAPVEWEATDIEKTLSANSNVETLASCGGGGPFTITAYVAPSGKVLSAGISHTDDSGEETAACLVSKIEAMRFPSPGSWRAKVSFRL